MTNIRADLCIMQNQNLSLILKLSTLYSLIIKYKYHSNIVFPKTTLEVIQYSVKHTVSVVSLRMEP